MRRPTRSTSPRPRSPGYAAIAISAVRDVEAVHPFGPRLGCPVNITALGNDDRLDIGIALDTAAVAEPDIFLRSMGEAFETFVPDAESSSTRVTKRSSSCCADHRRSPRRGEAGSNPPAQNRLGPGAISTVPSGKQ